MNSIINLENALIDTKTWMDGVKLKMNLDKLNLYILASEQKSPNAS